MLRSIRSVRACLKFITEQQTVPEHEHKHESKDKSDNEAKCENGAIGQLWGFEIVD
jgi:hypothetical protein